MANKLKAMADVAANEAHEADRTSVAIKANEAYNAEANDDTKAIKADKANSTSGCCKIARLISQ